MRTWRLQMAEESSTSQDYAFSKGHCNVHPYCGLLLLEFLDRGPLTGDITYAWIMPIHVLRTVFSRGEGGLRGTWRCFREPAADASLSLFCHWLRRALQCSIILAEITMSAARKVGLGHIDCKWR